MTDKTTPQDHPHDPADQGDQGGDQARLAELERGLANTRAQIAELAEAAGRPAPRLLPVTKFHPAEDIALLSQLGVTDVAENREQEARAKAEQLPEMRFHMIGQIQTKKANHVARWAHSVHSLDSEKLAHALDRGVELARERGQRSENLPVYVQLSYDSDPSRGGAAWDTAEDLLRVVEDLDNLDLRGIMVVPPVEADAAEVFAVARQLADELGEKLGHALELSAGMSADLREAIFAGTDIVRVGTGIMGTRPVG